MKKDRLEYFKKLLLEMKNKIMKDLDSIEDQHIHHSGSKEFGDSSYPIHMADVADIMSDAELGFKLKNSEEVILMAIEAALKRIEEGTYGICQDCGTRIRDERLEIMPFAVRCINCKTEYEKRNSLIFILGSFAVSVTADIVTKEIVAAKMFLNQSISVFGDLLRMTYLKNSGIAFGMFKGFSDILIWVSLAVVVVLLLSFKGLFTQRKIVKAAYGMILGGATGNIIDRLRFQSVRDFIDVGLSDSLRWPVFNIADSLIFIGIFIIIIFSERNGRSRYPDGTF